MNEDAAHYKRRAELLDTALAEVMVELRRMNWRPEPRSADGVRSETVYIAEISAERSGALIRASRIAELALIGKSESDAALEAAQAKVREAERALVQATEAYEKAVTDAYPS